jgi:hypothetical protein
MSGQQQMNGVGRYPPPEPSPHPSSLQVSVVIPCLNEEKTIRACVEQAWTAIRATGCTGEVIVVDNGSTDLSVELATAAGARVVHEAQRGYGQAYLRGLAEANGEAILMGDGDGTYDFNELGRFLDRLNGGADLVLGSRLRGQILPGAMPWHHRWIGNPLLTGMLNLLYRSGLSDAHCGLRMVRRSALPRLALASPGMEFASEMVIKARRAGLRCEEIPIAYYPRPRGSNSKLKSTADGLRHLAFMLAFLPAAVFYPVAMVVGGIGLALLIASDRSAGGTLIGTILLSAGGFWGLVGLAVRTYKRMGVLRLEQALGGRPWILSGAALAGSAGVGVVALVVAWRAALTRNGSLLSTGGGRITLGALILAFLSLGTALAIVQTRFRQPSGEVESSPDASGQPFELWSRPPLSWLKRTKRHPIFIGALVLAAGLRVIVMLAYRPALIFHGDSFGYLANAQNLVPDPMRPIVYPLLLHVLLPFHNLMVVTGVQHVMGLATGVLVYALLRRLGARQILATLGAGPVLFDAYQLNIEHYVLTEPLFELLVVGAIALVVWPKRASLASCLVAGLLLAAAGLTRTVGLVLIFPLVAYALITGVGPRRAVALTMAFLIPLLGYATWFNKDNGPFALTSFDGDWLYGRVAQFADCTGLQLPPYERVLCESIPTATRLGPNFYVWSGKSPIHRLHPPRGVSKDAALRDFAIRVILHQPIDYARTVGGELLHYFEPGRAVGPRDYPVSTWQFRPFRIRFDAQAQVYVLDGRFPRIDRPLATKLWTYQRLAYTNGPLLALALLLGLAGAVGLRRGAARPLRAESVLLTSSGFLLLLAVEMTSSFDYRYLLPSLPLLGAGGALGASILWRRRPPRAGDAIVPAATSPVEAPAGDVISISEPGPKPAPALSGSAAEHEEIVERELEPPGPHQDEAAR